MDSFSFSIKSSFWFDNSSICNAALVGKKYRWHVATIRTLTASRSAASLSLSRSFCLSTGELLPSTGFFRGFFRCFNAWFRRCSLACYRIIIGKKKGRQR